ncbi:hypothetical protein FRC03_000445 [Tulasnella sp. 419]|nr:hypothetical protein FRC03_000445 [Tulasnella sp. 419]
MSQATDISTSQTTGIPPPGIVGSSTVNTHDEEMKDTPEILWIRHKCPRFRILVIGKANSGKTTILQKMSGTTDTPIVRDRNGEKIDPSILEDPTAMRGMHDIENEIYYPSNPHFVFHDSRGFEAGSTEEIDKVRSFIKQRAAENKLKDRLHVIWYCVPMDQKRVLGKAELSFFENGTGDVPVIVLFTKWDGHVVQSFSDLKQQGRNILAAHREASEHAMGIFKTHYLPVITDVAYPPAAYVLLGSMHKQEATCSDLVETTARAMSNRALRKLFISVQETNIQLSIRSATEDVLGECKPVHVLGIISWVLIVQISFSDIPFEWPNTVQEQNLEDVAYATSLWFHHVYV